ncbi:YihY/virulence factor BrkB family protein [Streptomonospora sp. S1-112]|uniref:YihY/virulence factor BrkB family protein n=1 Tax=Streptomonospora mangrovi TaxID=2883123 RepID=A0A9X3SGS0_9ACTN|nr:YihY/virulence factor BrkB family protein [Streptomonospora mangrovi]MDA0567222.1 YihY/virulence factor BrkB family protein [Streptomonospora mangrovi]
MLKRAARDTVAWADHWCQAHPRTARVGVLVGRTARTTARTRVVGLAAESAFFSLLSLPALLLGLVGTLGHLRPVLGTGTVLEIRVWLLDLAATVLTADTVDSIVAPLVDEFLAGAETGLLSVTFLISLWSGSRAMNVFIDAITIAYGLDELRGYVRQRVLAFVAYLGGLLFVLAVLPVLVAGPDLVHRLLPATVGYLNLAYWPTVGGLSTLAVALLYVLSTPVRTPLWRYLPGALVAMAVLLAGSVLLRLYLDASFGQVTIYGSLSAPIAILAWLWLMALAVLIGSALNAEIDAMWPTPRTAAARARIAARRHARARALVDRREAALRSAGPVPEPDDEQEITARMRRLLGWGGDRYLGTGRDTGDAGDADAVTRADHGADTRAGDDADTRTGDGGGARPRSGTAPGADAGTGTAAAPAPVADDPAGPGPAPGPEPADPGRPRHRMPEQPDTPPAPAAEPDAGATPPPAPERDRPPASS